MRYDTHLVLVSGQPTPNLTPALDPDIKPQRIIMLVSQDMKDKASWLERIYKPRGINVTTWPIENAWDTEHIQYRVMELVEHEKEASGEKSLALNATGGTKPMSIAAYEVFRASDLPIYYVHPERDQLIWLHDSSLAPHQLADRIKMPDFLDAHGALVTGKEEEQVPPEYRELAQQLVNDVVYFSGALGKLNWYAQKAAKNKSLRSESIDDSSGFAAFQDLLDRLEEVGIISNRRDLLQFSSEDARFFANGGWLEQYVFSMVNSLKKNMPIIQDTAQGLKISRGKGKSTNELDVVVLANNQLRLIECKTKTFKGDNANSGAETLYKLDSLADNVGGLKAKAMLISYKVLNKHDRQRARDLGIEVLEERKLQNLEEHLKHWIK